MPVGQCRDEHGAQVSHRSSSHGGRLPDTQVLAGGERLARPDLRAQRVVVARGARDGIVPTLEGRGAGEVGALQYGNRDAPCDDERPQAGPKDLSDSPFPRFHVALRLAALLGGVKPFQDSGVLHHRIDASCRRHRW